MDIQKTILIIFITLIVVIIFNLGIYSYAKKRGSQINLFTRVYHRAKSPWKEENEKMKELSDYIQEYKENRKRDEENIDHYSDP